MKRSNVVFIVLATSLVATITVLMSLPPFTACNGTIPVTDKERWFQATRTVVEPWRGPHHVYALFTVPARYRRDRLYTAQLVIKGFVEDFPETSPEAGSVPAIVPEADHYLMRVNLPTRIALWLLITGRFGDLKEPCHWWLVVADRS